MSAPAKSTSGGVTPESLAGAAQKLTVDREDAIADLGWLEDGFRDPASFWSALMALWTGGGPPAKSRVLERYDLHHDVITRHADGALAAFAWFDRVARKVQSISYAELEERSARKAGEWAAQKVKAGAVIAVVLPVGRDWLVALLAALRLGAVASFVPPIGPRYVATRLAKASPAHVASDPIYAPMLGKLAEKMLADGPSAARPYDRSHTYASGSPCSLVFSPLREPLDEPVPLAIDDAYLLALRDGLLTFSLEPGDVIAAPGLVAAQHQPSLVFAALFAGATYFHLGMEDLAIDPRLLLRFPLRAIGVSNELRDRLIAAPLGAITTWRHWWKNPEEPFDPAAWSAFVDAHGLGEVPSSNVLIDAASGGATLFSVRRPRGQSSRVLPAAGGPWVAIPPKSPPWALYDLAGSGDPARGSAGLYAPAPTKKPAELGHAVLSVTSGGEHVYGGTLDPRRSGRVYPEADVLAVVRDLPFVADAAVVATSAGGAPARSLFLLVIFTGAEESAAAEAAGAARESAIQRALRGELGPDAEPDQIVFFPLYARRKKAEADRAWCEAQLLRGTLRRKADEPVFQRLTAVRKRFVRDVGAA